MKLQYELSHELSKKEQAEVNELEKLFFDEEGNPRVEVMQKERVKGMRLKALYLKQGELYIASCN